MTDLDLTADAPRDIWEGAVPLEVRGITADDIRDLWQRTWPNLGEAESTVFELALSDRRDREAEAAREALTAAYMGVVKSITRTHAGQRADHDDIRQTALMGLWRGFREAERKGVAPKVTIQRTVLAALSDAHAARFAMSVSEKDRLAFSAARRAAEALLAEEGATTEPEGAGVRGGWTNAGSGVDELAASLAPEHGLATDAYWLIYRVLFVFEVQPSGEVSRSGEDSFLGEGATYTQTEAARPIAGEPAEVSDAAAALVAALLDRLEPAERHVVALRYGLDGQPVHTEEEAAEAVGRTTRRVRQIVAGALAKLREVAPAE